MRVSVCKGAPAGWTGPGKSGTGIFYCNCFFEEERPPLVQGENCCVYEDGETGKTFHTEGDVFYPDNSDYSDRFIIVLLKRIYSRRRTPHSSSNSSSRLVILLV